MSRLLAWVAREAESTGTCNGETIDDGFMPDVTVTLSDHGLRPGRAVAERKLLGVWEIDG